MKIALCLLTLVAAECLILVAGFGLIGLVLRREVEGIGAGLIVLLGLPAMGIGSWFCDDWIIRRFYRETSR